MAVGEAAAVIYGILAIVGGVIGYRQARSNVSLISGVVSGLLLLLGAFLWIRGSAAGAGLAVAVTIVLVAVFIRRWMQTRKVMPAGLMIGVGVLALILMLSGLAAG